MWLITDETKLICSDGCLDMDVNYTLTCLKSWTVQMLVLWTASQGVSLF